MEMDTELFKDRAVFKIGTPVRVKGIGFHFDPAVTHDLGVGWTNQPEPDQLAVFCPLPGVCRKRPFTTVQRTPVFTGHPSRRFFWMSAFGPCPQALPNQRFHLRECALGGGMTVIAPASYTGSPFVRVLQVKDGVPTAHHFGQSLKQRLWLFVLDDACGSSLVLGVPSSLTLGSPNAGDSGNFLTVISFPQGQRYIVPAASHPTVASRASASRLLRTKPQVYLYFEAPPFIVKQSSQPPQVAASRRTKRLLLPA
jgi:hypothetical protein